MKTLRALHVLCVITTLGTPAARAQTGTVAGTIRNAATREPLEGVIVTVKGTRYAAASGANGTFTILGVPSGSYAISARRFGFNSRELTGVDVPAGRTRTIAFSLRMSPADTVERAEFSPLFVDPFIGGTAISLGRAQIADLPALSMSSALGVHGGYLELPRSAATLSLADLHRGVTGLGSVRGARPEATLYLLDGINASNPVFASPPLLIEPLSAASVTVSPAHADAEYGGVLSGLVNQAVREGGDEFRGGIEYQTTAIAGRLGSAASAASGTSVLRGFVGGAAPWTNDNLRFMIAGHVLGEKPTVRRASDGSWQSIGDTEHDQLIAKLTYAIRPSLIVALTALGQRRSATGVDPGLLQGDTVAPELVVDDTRLLIGRAEKRFSRASASLTLGDTRGDRRTCSMWQGVCILDRFARNPVGAEIPAFPPPPAGTPYDVSGMYTGGEAFHTRTARADLVAQASDHHEIRLGVYAARHDISYADAIGYRWLQGTILTVKDVYRTAPVEFASYIQDAIQHDLFTFHIGARFDYGNTGGLAFADPLNPTNGTTAREVCDGRAPGMSETPFEYNGMYGLTACILSPPGENGRPVLLDSATRLAQSDDFRAVRPRVAFSPRIGLSFPLTETSGLFLNVGRFARQPLYHDAFRNTGAGSRAGSGPDGDCMCPAARTLPATNACSPNLLLDPTLPEFVGNPDLSFQVSDAFEAGFTSQWGRVHSLETSVFSSTQWRWGSIFTGALPADIGATYGVLSQGSRRTVLSRGSISSMGLSFTVRRRLEHAMTYTVNYTWQRSSEIGGTPDLVAEALTGGPAFDDSIERFASRNRAHALSGIVSWQWREATPPELGSIGAVLLRNSRTTVTASGGTGSSSRARLTSECTTCPAFGGGVEPTGVLAHVLYVRTLTTSGPRWALIARVRNVLNVDDGSRSESSLDVRRRTAASGTRIPPGDNNVSLRRILAGVSVNF